MPQRGCAESAARRALDRPRRRAALRHAQGRGDAGARHRGASTPWQLDFKLGFAGSAATTFDNRGRVLHANSIGAGLNMASQGALATGVAYYHRKDLLQYPNLLNPFWRATLVASDVDKGGKGRAFDNDDTCRAGRARRGRAPRMTR